MKFFIILGLFFLMWMIASLINPSPENYLFTKQWWREIFIMSGSMAIQMLGMILLENSK